MKAATKKKKRRLTRKQVCKVLRAYNLGARVDAYLETLGPLVWRKPEGMRSAERDIVILTRIGMLGVSEQTSRRFPAPENPNEPDPFWEYREGGHDDQIMCVFDDALAGHRAVGAAIISGKWNHHAFAGYCHEPTDPDAMVQQVQAALGRFIAGVESITLNRTPQEIDDALLRVSERTDPRKRG